MAEIVRNPAAATNPPDPQVPVATAIPVPDPATTVANNPPNPQVPPPAPPITGRPTPAPAALPPAPPGFRRDPVTGALTSEITTGTITTPNDPDTTEPPPDQPAFRIDIEGVGLPVINDEVTTLPPDDAGSTSRPLPRAEVAAPPVVVVDLTVPQPVTAGPGITGPVPGISPYGEQDAAFEPTAPITTPQPIDDFEFEQQQAARAAAAEADAFRRGQIPAPVTGDPQADPRGPAFDDDGFLQPGFTLNGDGEPVFIGDGFIDPSLTASAEASRAAARQQATLNNARQQATIQSQRKQNNDRDWRVRLSLAPQANYLYRAPDVDGQPGSGILAPLARTNGVIFPYTPRITSIYEATYNEYQLTHSNYRGYFYQGSKVGDLQIEATFTAQDTAEADYLLAVIHFFRSITKMFYGQDPQRGTPPPLVYLSGYGEYQYNLHPCVVHTFNYNLPGDVDYIRARSKNTIPPGLLQRRQRQSVPTNIFSSVWARLSAAGLRKGAQPAPPPVPSLGIANATYVPTKLDMTIILKPIQSRQQVSRQFRLDQYANGDLLKAGFW